MSNFTLDRSHSGLLLVDVQDSLFPYVEHSCEVLKKMQMMIKAAKILGLPIFVTEQYPKGLGSTIHPLKSILDSNQEYYPKTSFSSLKDKTIREKFLSQPLNQWILIGIEAHVCILQTAKDLKAAGKEVVVVNDAISSRSIYDFSTAIADMRDSGIRIISTETAIFEWVGDSQSKEFKAISDLIKQQSCCQCA